MSLESLLGPAKWVDKKLQKQYTKIGQKIPEESLYKITTALGLCGLTGGVIMPMPLTIFYGGFIGGTDLALNIEGIKGEFPKQISGETQAIHPIHRYQMKLIRATRLPLFAAGAGLIGKAAYDVANFFINGEPVKPETYREAISGVGFISSASSMYLKDQDTKLLKKQPSKLKEFFKVFYEKAKSLLPHQNPEPVIENA